MELKQVVRELDATMMAVKTSLLHEFLTEAQLRLQEKRDEEEQAALAHQMQNRQAWGIVLDNVREQLPDVLQELVTVAHVEAEGRPYAGERTRRGIQLQVPGCTPIILAFECYSWQIDTFWPKEATGIWEEDDQAELEWTTPVSFHDVYLAVAIAHENYPKWAKLEQELERSKQGS